MKTVLGVLILILNGLVSSGQRQPILPYGHYGPSEIKSFVEGDSPKAKQYKDLLLHKTGEDNLDSLLKKVFIRDTTFEAGVYDNTCWDVSTQKVFPFLGEYFKGKVYVYRNKIFEMVLWKDTCANILNTGRRYLNLIPEDQPHKVVKVDSLGGGTIINNTTTNIVNNYGAKDTIPNKSLENLGTTHNDSVKWYNTTVARIGEGLLLAYGGYRLYGLLNKEKPQVVEKKPDPIIPPVVEPRRMPPDGIPSDPRTMPPDGIPGETPETETPTTEPETPSTPGLDAEPRGMPSGISGKFVTVGVVLPAPWGWGR